MSLLAAESFQDRLSAILDDLVDFLPKFLAALGILIIGWIVARIIQRVVVSILKRLRFDELVDKAGLGAGLARSGYPDSGVLLAKILYYVVLLIALQLAINVFGESQVQEALNGLIELLPKIVVALIIVVITGWVANVVRALVAPAVNHLGARVLIVNAVVATIWLIGVFAAIDQIGVAENVVQTLFQVVVGSLGFILIIKFGVGGVWAARDRFWPSVYDKFTSSAPAAETESES